MEEKDESKKIEIFRNLFNKAEQIFDNDLDLWVKATEENERKGTERKGTERKGIEA